MEDINARQHVIVFSQRRMGKTSLVAEVLEEAKSRGIIPVFLDENMGSSDGAPEAGNDGSCRD